MPVAGHAALAPFGKTIGVDSEGPASCAAGTLFPPQTLHQNGSNTRRQTERVVFRAFTCSFVQHHVEQTQLDAVGPLKRE